MSGKTKIVVLHMKEVLYTLIFLILAIFLAILLFVMFGSKKESAASEDRTYQPGVYTSSISLNNNTFDVEVVVDAAHIKSIRMVNLSESTTAMFPLMEPSLETLANQIYRTQSLDQVQYSEDNRYTSMLLLNAISDALAKAEEN